MKMSPETKLMAPIPTTGLKRRERRQVGLVSSQEQQLRGIAGDAKFWTFILTAGHPLLRSRGGLLDPRSRHFVETIDVTQRSLVEGRRGLFLEVERWEREAGELFARYANFEAGRMWTTFHGGELAEQMELDMSLQMAALGSAVVEGHGYDLAQLGRTVIVGDRKMADIVIVPNGRDAFSVYMVPQLVAGEKVDERTIDEVAIAERFRRFQVEQMSPLVVFGNKVGKEEFGNLATLFDATARLMFNLRRKATVVVDDVRVVARREVMSERRTTTEETSTVDITRKKDGHSYSGKELEQGVHIGELNIYKYETRESDRIEMSVKVRRTREGLRQVPLDVVRMVLGGEFDAGDVLEGVAHYPGAQWDGQGAVTMGEVAQVILGQLELQFKPDLQEVLNAAKDVALFNAQAWKRAYPDMDKQRLEWFSFLVHMTWPTTMIRYFENYSYRPLTEFISGFSQNEAVLARVR